MLRRNGFLVLVFLLVIGVATTTALAGGMDRPTAPGVSGRPAAGRALGVGSEQTPTLAPPRDASPSAAGTEVQTNLGEPRVPHPVTHHYQGRNPSQFNILLCSDSCEVAPPDTCAEVALRNLGHSYTLFYQDWAGCETALGSGIYDVALIDNSCFFPVESLFDALDAFLTAGGRTIVNTFDMDAFPAHPLWTTAGVAFAEDVTDSAPPVYRWQPGHPAVSGWPADPLQFQDLYIDDGDKIDALALASLLAGYTAAPEAGEGAFSLRNDQMAMVSGFCLDNLAGSDQDDNGVTDCVQVWQSAISWLLASGCTPPSADFTWTPVAPVVGEQVSFTGSAEGTLPLFYAWDFGDGATGSGAAVTHAYAVAGTYTVSLEVVNACGAAVALRALTVGGAPTPGPTPTPGCQSWAPVGPEQEAPGAYQVLIDPANPSRVYAGTAQGVYRSTDGGESWTPANEGLGGYGGLVISGLVRHPTDANTLYVATWGYGIYRSTDQGNTWTRLADPLATGRQAGPSGDGAPPEVRAGGPSNRVALSLGETKGGPWAIPSHAPSEAPQAPLPLTWTPVRRMTINPANGNEIFACIDAGNGLYRSTDGGSSWAYVPVGTGSAWSYTFAPSNLNIRYATYNNTSTIYRTTNGGSSWQNVTGSIGASVFSVAVHPSNPNLVLAGTLGDGLYRTTDGGNSWTKVSAGLADTAFLSVAFAPSDPNVAYAGGYSWVYRSTDGGVSWANADTSLPNVYFEGLAIHPTQPETVYVGSGQDYYGGVWKRTQPGAAFALKNTGMQDVFVLDLEQDPLDEDILYLSTWAAGVFRSDDGGTTWNFKGGVPYVYDVEATQGPSGVVLYAATFYSDWGVLRSTDRGETWTEVSNDLHSNISFDLEAINNNSQDLLAATYMGVEWSTDGGVTWNDASGLDSGIVLRLAQFPGTSQFLAATYGGGIYRSTDWGRSWAVSNSGIPPYSDGNTYTYDVVGLGGGTAYVGTLQVYRSGNYGASWQVYGTGLPNNWVRAVSKPGVLGYLAAGIRNQGVYLASPDGTWAELNAGLGEQRILALKSVGVNPLAVLAGTYGRSAWKTSCALRLGLGYLPIVMRGYVRSVPTPIPTATPIPTPIGWQTIVYEDFEGAFPGVWTVFDNESGYGEYYWGKRNCRPYAGSYSGWGVGGGANGSGLSCGSNYPDYTEGWMVYGPFSLVGASDGDLTFQLWLNTENNYDFVCRMASTDGANFSGSCTSGSSGGWISRELDLTNVPGLGNLMGRSSVWIALIFDSDLSIHYPEGGYVDNILLRRYMGLGGAAGGATEVLPEGLHEWEATMRLERAGP